MDEEAVINQYNETQQLLRDIYKDTNMGFVPNDDEKGADLANAADITYQLYLTDQALYGKAIISLYEELKEEIREFAREKGVTLQQETRFERARANI